MHVHDALSLLLFALGAFLIPLGAGRIGVPAAVGEIIYGVVVGPHVIGLMHKGPMTTFLAELGFAFLMFLVGLEIDFSRIERAGTRNVAVSAIAAAAVFVVAWAATLVLDLPLFLALVFAAMSVGILLVTLNEVGMTKSDAGQGMIFVGSLGEALTIVALTALSFYYRFGIGLRLALELGKLVAIFLAAYAVLVLLRTLIWWKPASFMRVVRTHDPSEVGVRAGMALMLSFVALAALLGIEPILGAFLAGALFSFVFRAKGVLETKLSSIGFGFFVPIFFIWVGTEFDVSVVGSTKTWVTVATYAGASLIAKLLPSMLLLARGFSLRQCLGSALLLGAPLTLLVAIARIGLDVKVISKSSAAAVVLLAIVTGIVFPMLFRLLFRPRAATPQ
ncbi:MAG: cation:proton antiporter [Myxococcales bacterium]|nr:cation:proton antiporter [Myxococcales bacterium]